MNQPASYLQSEAPEEDSTELVREFVKTNPDYYRSQFNKIGATSRFAFTFNVAAALLGPIWFGMRNLWKWGLPFLLLEIFALIQIARGLFGNLGAEALERAV